MREYINKVDGLKDNEDERQAEEQAQPAVPMIAPNQLMLTGAPQMGMAMGGGGVPGMGGGGGIPGMGGGA